MNITISGTTYDASLPVGGTITHEGGLDQANIVIRHISKQDAFLPFTEVEFLGQWWVIARDDVVRERYIGRATHTIMLVEATKRLERVICGAKTFSRPLVPVYPQRQATPKYYKLTLSPEDMYEVSEDEMHTTPDVGYTSPQIKGGTVTVEGADLITWNNKSLVDTNMRRENKTVAISANGTDYTDVGGSQEAQIGTANLEKLYIRYRQYYSPVNDPGQPLFVDETLYVIEFVSQVQAKDPFTIWEVTERLLVTATPTTDATERAYFHSTTVTGAIDTKTITSPGFSFANGASLKENLDQIAKVLHAKVKMTKVGGAWNVYYIPLTKNETATVQGTLIGDETSFDSAKYAGRVITNAANLVVDNTEEGGISDPCGNRKEGGYIGARTLRCSDSQARINEDTGEISTILPIRKITKVTMYVPSNSEASSYKAPVDITDRVIEEAEYKALSDYTASEYNKGHYLYYRQGAKNIWGLFFKPNETYVPDAMKKYAIVNIYNDKKPAASPSLSSFDNYADIAFNVEYEPYMDLMLMNSREDGKGGTVDYIANQAANEVDKDALADFARGTIEQMASDSPKKTYLMPSLSSVPEVGTMFDETHYITEVSFQIYPYFVKCTLSIAEHYNRLGEHVEVANAVRQYEVDANNVYNRNVLYTDVCNVSVGLADPTASPPLLNGTGRANMLRHLVDRANNPYYHSDLRLSVAEIDTLNGYHQRNVLPDAGTVDTLQRIMLPVASFGFGNSLVFVIPFEDNFLAGTYASHEGLSSGTNYNLQYFLQYGDAYGDVDFISLKLRNGLSISSDAAMRDAGRALPNSVAGMPGVVLGDIGARTASGRPVIVYKDGRERIVFVYQVLFQSDCGIIIGSDFASWCPLVRDYSTGEYLGGATMRFYRAANVLDPIKGTTLQGDYASFIEADITTSGIAYVQATGYIEEHQSWAIIKNGKFMLGGNFNLYNYSQNGRIYFNTLHDFIKTEV